MISRMIALLLFLTTMQKSIKASNMVTLLEVLPTPGPTAQTPLQYYQQEDHYVQIPGRYNQHYEDDHAVPKYEYSYAVADEVTGDFHSHQEVRDGEVTKGQYSLHEADGSIRTVRYSVHGKSGFNAIVERTAQGQLLI